MRGFLIAHLVHVLAMATLLSRLGDIGTTWLVTPTLKVEANPFVRRLGWKYAIATVVVAVIPYYSIHGGVMLLTTSFIISAMNGSEAILARSLGEDAYAELHRQAMRKLSIPVGLSLMCLPGIFTVLLGLSLSLLFPVSINDWGFDVAMGSALSGLALLLFYPIRFFSERRLGNGLLAKTL